MFSVQDRDRIRDRLLQMARSDSHVVAAAALGSLAHDEGDRWSDLDLMFAVADEVPVDVVLETWTQTLADELGATHLFDLRVGRIVYRVFLLPSSLELDLSFVPASAFRPAGARFKVLFGEALEAEAETPTDAEEVFGYAVHHALHARAAIGRGRYWQAEYWIGEVRDRALILACLRRGLDGWYGRDFDRLPTDVLDPMHDALVRKLEHGELDRALTSAVSGLLKESGDVRELAQSLEPQLREVAGTPAND